MGEAVLGGEWLEGRRIGHKPSSCTHDPGDGFAGGSSGIDAGRVRLACDGESVGGILPSVAHGPYHDPHDFGYVILNADVYLEMLI